MYQTERLISKRNEVYRVYCRDNIYITKLFNKADDLEWEAKIITELHQKGINAPNIIKITGNTMILEDLGNVTFLDWIDCLEQADCFDIEDAVSKLSNWICKFYEEFNINGNQYVLYDVNFRNFIVKDNQIYGIDFEQVRLGSIANDIGKIIAYGLMYNPIMTRFKIEFCHRLLEEFVVLTKIDKNTIIAETAKEMKSIVLRRKLELSDAEIKRCLDYI